MEIGVVENGVEVGFIGGVDAKLGGESRRITRMSGTKTSLHFHAVYVKNREVVAMEIKRGERESAECNIAAMLSITKMKTGIQKYLEAHAHRGVMRRGHVGVCYWMGRVRMLGMSAGGDTRIKDDWAGLVWAGV